MTLRTLHRTTAWLIALFAVLHLSNHAASLLSIPTHIAFMDVARAQGAVIRNCGLRRRTLEDSLMATLAGGGDA